MKDEYKLLDVNGEIVTISTAELYTVFVAHPDFRLFGMPYDAILKCKKMYDIAGGPMPVTADRIEMVFHKPEVIIAKPYNRNPPTHRAPDQYPQERRQTDKNIEKENHEQFFDYLDKLSETYRPDDFKGCCAKAQEIIDRELSFAGLKIKEGVTMEDNTFRISRMDGIPRIFGWQNPQFSYAKSLDGKNVTIKKKKVVPTSLFLTIINGEVNEEDHNIFLKAIKKGIVPNKKVVASAVKKAAKAIRRNMLDSAMEVARKDMDNLVKANKVYMESNDHNAFEKISHMGATLGKFAEISNRIKAIITAIRKLDSK